MTDPQQLPTPRLRVVTREVDSIDDVLAHSSPSHPTFWSRRGDAIAAYGETIGVVHAGAASSFDFAARWRAISARAEIDDPLGLPGTGLIAFGAFAFDTGSAARSILSVPEVVVGRRGARRRPPAR